MGHSEEGIYKCSEPVSKWTVNVFFGVVMYIGTLGNGQNITIWTEFVLVCWSDSKGIIIV